MASLPAATTALKPPSRTRAFAAYVVPLLLMFSGWTLIRYVDQPYRSPTYRRTFAQCAAHAAWVVPAEGAGPLVPLSLMTWATLRDHEVSHWILPPLGGAIYLLFALTLSALGRRWSVAAHIVFGFAWLMAGAVILTRITMK